MENSNPFPQRLGLLEEPDFELPESFFAPLDGEELNDREENKAPIENQKAG